MVVAVEVGSRVLGNRLSKEKNDGTSKVGEGDGDGVKVTAIGEGADFLFTD